MFGNIVSGLQRKTDWSAPPIFHVILSILRSFLLLKPCIAYLFSSWEFRSPDKLKSSANWCFLWTFSKMSLMSIRSLNLIRHNLISLLSLRLKLKRVTCSTLKISSTIWFLGVSSCFMILNVTGCLTNSPFGVRTGSACINLYFKIPFQKSTTLNSIRGLQVFFIPCYHWTVTHVVSKALSNLRTYL